MNQIGWAVGEMWRGMKVRRAGWNGKGMWLRIVQCGDLKPVRSIDGHLSRLQNFVVMKAASGEIVPWICSQTDLLAWDWETLSLEEIAQSSDPHDP